MIFIWAPRVSFNIQIKLHDNPTSTVLLPQLRTLLHRRVKKNDPSKMIRNTHPCLPGRQTASLLWEEYIKQIHIYSCLMHCWLNWSHFAKIHTKKESTISCILWLVLANNLERGEVTCLRWWVRNLWGCWMETQVKLEQLFVFYFSPQSSLFTLRFFA